MSDDAIAVVAVTHDSRGEIAALVESVSAQLEPGDRLIVVDNASNDGTAALARTLDPSVAVVESAENRGFAAGCRLGVEHSTQPLILLLNPDARLEPGALARLRETAGERSDWSAWQAAVMLPDGRINTSGGVVHYLGIGWAGQCGRDASMLPGHALRDGVSVRRGADDPSQRLARVGGFEDALLPLLRGSRSRPAPLARPVIVSASSRARASSTAMNSTRVQQMVPARAQPLADGARGLPGAAARGGPAGAPGERARAPRGRRPRRLARSEAARAGGDARRTAGDAAPPPGRSAHPPRRGGRVRRASDGVARELAARAAAASSRALQRAYWGCVCGRSCMSYDRRPRRSPAAAGPMKEPRSRMSMILAWVLLPLVLAAVGLGWGALVEWAAGAAGLGAYTIPVGLAAAIVVAALFTAFSGTAPAAAPVVAVGGLTRPRPSLIGRAARPAAGARRDSAYCSSSALPVHPERAGDLPRLRAPRRHGDVVRPHRSALPARTLGRRVPLSTYQTLVNTNLNASAYPAGAFMLLGVGHWTHGHRHRVDLPAVSGRLRRRARVDPVRARRVARRRPLARAFVAFIGAQSALLFGYAAWGGIKELTAAPCSRLAWRSSRD